MCIEVHLILGHAVYILIKADFVYLSICLSNYILCSTLSYLVDRGANSTTVMVSLFKQDQRSSSSHFAVYGYQNPLSEHDTLEGLKFKPTIRVVEKRNYYVILHTITW